MPRAAEEEEQSLLVLRQNVAEAGECLLDETAAAGSQVLNNQWQKRLAHRGSSAVH